ncbi:MAG: glycine-rich protein [Planctomycetota bacterium]|nr:glycine-rich protein [Planctomycetota bacterium]
MKKQVLLIGVFTILALIVIGIGIKCIKTASKDDDNGSSTPPPAQVTSPTPSNGSTGRPNNQQLSWAAASGATSYDVWFDVLNPPEVYINTTSTTYTPGTLDYLATYYWRINSRNSSGLTIGNVWSFTTISAPPARVDSPTPSNNSTDRPINQQLSWGEASGATSYNVYFGTNNPPSNIGTNTTSRTYNPGTLSPGATYYWRINSKDSTATTTGTIWSFTTVPLPPAQATLPAPANGQTDVSITQHLSWALVSSATSYDVYFGKTLPVTFRISTTNTAGRSYNPDALDFNTPYYWRIDTKNAGGTTEGSDWNFRTLLPISPTQVTLLNPTNGQTNVITQCLLSWRPATNAVSYDVYFGTDNPPTYKTNTTGGIYNPGPLNYTTSYYWRVDSKNTFATTPGNVWSFTTQQIPASQVTTPNPTNGATGVITTTPMSWASASNAISYDVCFGTDNPPTYKTNTAGTTYNPGTLSYSNVYYWRIDSKNSTGNITTGIVWNFTTIALPAPPSCTTGSTINITAYSATLNGTVNANGVLVTACYFDYGTSPSYGSTATASPAVGGGGGNVAVSAPLSGLTPTTQYYFRVVATNAQGTTNGNNQTFTTPGVQTATFNYNGAVQTFVVPAGVNSMRVDVYGAQGGSIGALIGGLGARVQATLVVTAGETLYIYVGGAGSLAAGGWNGGGVGDGFSGAGGGGASDIRRGGTAFASRIIVAGGGGGNGYTAGGGAGGYPSGATGGPGVGPGGGGTQFSGGWAGFFGSAGTLGNGGSGSIYDGGGGGGRYGGGSGDGAGGGSSLISGTNTSYTNGFQSGNGLIIITY